MTRINDGGPAFPRPASEFTKNGTLPDGNNAIDEQDGMSLRDYFAAAALTGELASQSEAFTYSNQFDAAQRAFEHADAMLARRHVRLESKPAPMLDKSEPSALRGALDRLVRLNRLEYAPDDSEMEDALEQAEKALATQADSARTKTDPLRGFVDLVAAMTPYDMETCDADDALETLNSLIAEAVKLNGGAL